MSKVRAICISEKKGTAKVKVPKAEFIEDFELRVMLMLGSGIDK